MKKQEKHKQMQKKDHEVDKEKVIKRLKSPYSATKNIKADLHARFSREDKRLIWISGDLNLLYYVSLLIQNSYVHAYANLCPQSCEYCQLTF